MEAVIAFIFLACILGCVFMVQANGVNNNYKFSVNQLKKKHPEIFDHSEDYRFYTTGHPYVWVDTDLESILGTLKSGCSGYKGMPTFPVYHIRVDNDKKEVYFVNGQSDEEFDTLMHYDEWIESNREVAENIANDKASRFWA